jgi:hypothetical protein
MIQMLGHGRSRATLVVVGVLALDAFATGTANASPHWTWHSGAPVPARLDAQSCASASLCVAIEQSPIGPEGSLLISTDPTRRASTWTQTDVDGNTPLAAVACRASSFCVAVDTHGNVLSSRDPTGGPSAWKIVNVDPPGVVPGFNASAALTCPSTRLCLALDGSGRLLISRHPSGGATGWKVEQVDPNKSAACYYEHKTGPNCRAALEYLACPSVSMCVAVDDSGRILTSTHPAAEGKKWSSWGPRTPNFHWLIGLSCPTTTFCLGGQPTGGGVAAWNPTRPRTNPRPVGDDHGGILGEFCLSARWCFTWLNSNKVFISTDPGSTHASWTPTTLPGGKAALQSMSCPTTTICLASVATFTPNFWGAGPQTERDSLDLVTSSRGRMSDRANRRT